MHRVPIEIGVDADGSAVGQACTEFDDALATDLRGRQPMNLPAAVAQRPPFSISQATRRGGAACRIGAGG